MTRAISHASSRQLLWPVAVALPALALTWAYWTTLVDVSSRWSHDPQYSHGYLVPVFAAVLLWLRRDSCPADGPRPSWWGLPLLAFGITLRLVGTYYYYVWLDPISLVPTLMGACLMIGGKPMIRWAWPSIVFLTFMIPLPFRASTWLSGPLQSLATICSTFALQTLGLPAIAEGNTILLDDKELGIVEACSGLRMLVVFFALSTGMALVIKRRLWEKLLIVASAAPIALVANVLRITATGVLYQMGNSEAAEKFFHDLAGWFMMPLALAMLGLVLFLLSRLLIEPSDAGPLPVGRPVVRPAAAKAAAATGSPLAPKRTPWKKPAPAPAAREAEDVTVEPARPL
jgi:exosortase